MAFDFPTGPAIDQIYTSPDGILYLWNGFAWMKGSGSGSAGGGAEYVLKTGDTMTGFLTLSGQPTAPMHAAPKQYVDAIQGVPPGGLDGQALVANSNLPVWGAPVNGGIF